MNKTNTKLWNVVWHGIRMLYVYKMNCLQTWMPQHVELRWFSCKWTWKKNGLLTVETERWKVKDGWLDVRQLKVRFAVLEVYRACTVACYIVYRNKHLPEHGHNKHIRDMLSCTHLNTTSLSGHRYWNQCVTRGISNGDSVYSGDQTWNAVNKCVKRVSSGHYQQSLMGASFYVQLDVSNPLLSSRLIGDIQATGHRSYANEWGAQSLCKTMLLSPVNLWLMI